MKKLLAVLFGFIMTINLIPVAVLGAWEVPKLDLVQSTCVAALSGTDFRMTVQAENYNVGGEGVGFHVVEPKTEPEIANGGSGQIVGFQPAEWLCYDVTVPVSGEYRIAMSTAADYAEQSVIVSVDGKELAYKTVPSSGGWAVYKEEEVLLVNLTAGSHTIKFENNSWGYNYDYFVIETLTAIKPTAFIFGGHMAEPGGTVNRGFDVIEVEFNNAFTAMPAQKNIKFSDSAGRPLPFDLKSSEKAVTLILKQSMAYGMTYTLSFTGLKDAYGNTVAGENYCFTACAIGADSGTESMVMGTSEIQDDTLNLSGRLLGSRGQGMAGRGIQIAVKNPDGSVLEVVQDASITKEDGIFDATYILPADAEIGLYQVLVGGLYMPESEKSKAEIYHVLSGDETTLLTELAQASTVSNIAKFFKTNEQKLGLSVTASLSGITDTKLVYQRFLGVKFEGVKQLRQRFFEIVALERLNQATKTETIQKLLGNQKDCAVLNIDGGKINYLPTSQKQVLQALLELERIEETEQVSANYNAIMDQFYRLEYQKQDLTMDIASQSAYAGQSVPLKIKLSDNASDLQSLTLMYRLTGGGTDILKKVTVKSDIAYDLKVENDRVLVTLTGDALKGREFGTVNFIMPTADKGAYAFEVSGNVVFRMENVPYLITTKVSPTNITLTAENNGGGNPGGGSNVRPGGGAGNSGGTAPVVQPPTKSPKPTAAPTPTVHPGETAVFQDLKGYEWATESILELNRMGIISGVNAIEFNPQENVTREEFVKMISLAFGIVNPDAVCAFTDVDPEDWYYSSVASAYQYGIVNGNSNGRFGIGEPITREDMAVLLDRLLTRLNIPLSESVYDLFEDDDMISDYARVAVYQMRSNQFFNGVGENQCAPREFANRASAAKMIYGVYLKTKTD